MTTTYPYRWLILIRLTSDAVSGNTIEGLGWRLRDHDGVLPNNNEELVLRRQAGEQFHKKFGRNASRTSLECVPWFPTDGYLPSWHDDLGVPNG
jgi:hypothetical protein